MTEPVEESEFKSGVHIAGMVFKNQAEAARRLRVSEVQIHGYLRVMKLLAHHGVVCVKPAEEKSY